MDNIADKVFESNFPASGIINLIQRRSWNCSFLWQTYKEEFGKLSLLEEEIFEQNCFLQYPKESIIKELESSGNYYKASLKIYTLKRIKQMFVPNSKVYLMLNDDLYLLSGERNPEGKYFFYTGGLYE